MSCLTRTKRLGHLESQIGGLGKIGGEGRLMSYLPKMLYLWLQVKKGAVIRMRLYVKLVLSVWTTEWILMRGRAMGGAYLLQQSLCPHTL